MPNEQTQLQSNRNTSAQLATLLANYQNMAQDIAEIRSDIRDLKGGYVTLDRYRPIEKIVYGFVAIVLIAVIGSIIGLIIVVKH